MEIEDHERLMSSLSNFHLSPILDSRSWVPSSSGVFSVKLFFFSLILFSKFSPLIPTNFLWKSRATSKVKAFVWLVTLKKVNTNDMLQLRRPFKVLGPDWCILYRSGETIEHLFLHYLITLGLWHRIFS